jgi:hypothetical protein
LLLRSISPSADSPVKHRCSAAAATTALSTSLRYLQT